MLSCERIGKSFGQFKVLEDVSLQVRPGRTVGLVGESGSGKSTFVNCAMRLMTPDTGRVLHDGIDVHTAKGTALKKFRRDVQLVFQDPYSSLNPRMTVEELVAEGLIVHQLEPSAARRRDRVAEVLSLVGLDPGAMDRYPKYFSGGQRQRIAIARALAIGPKLLVCDEPISALDVSVQAQIINLLQDMQQRLGLGILFVAHDLAVVRHLCDEIVVLESGRIVERGAPKAVFEAPSHAYTRALLDAVPVPDPVVAHRKREERRRRKAELVSSQE